MLDDASSKYLNCIPRLNSLKHIHVPSALSENIEDAKTEDSEGKTAAAEGTVDSGGAVARLSLAVSFQLALHPNPRPSSFMLCGSSRLQGSLSLLEIESESSELQLEYQSAQLSSSR